MPAVADEPDNSLPVLASSAPRPKSGVACHASPRAAYSLPVIACHVCYRRLNAMRFAVRERPPSAPPTGITPCAAEAFLSENGARVFRKFERQKIFARIRPPAALRVAFAYANIQAEC